MTNMKDWSYKSPNLENLSSRFMRKLIKWSWNWEN